MHSFSHEAKLTGVYMPLLWLLSVVVLHFIFPEYQEKISLWNIIPIITSMLIYMNNLRKENIECIQLSKRRTFNILLEKHIYIIWLVSTFFTVTSLAIYEISTPNSDNIGILIIALRAILSYLAFVVGSGGVMILLWSLSKTMNNKLIKSILISIIWLINTLALYFMGLYQNCTLYLLGFTLPGSPHEGDMGAWNLLSNHIYNFFLPIIFALLISIFYIKVSSMIIAKKN